MKEAQDMESYMVLESHSQQLKAAYLLLRYAVFQQMTLKESWTDKIILSMFCFRILNVYVYVEKPCLWYMTLSRLLPVAYFEFNSVGFWYDQHS